MLNVPGQLVCQLQCRQWGEPHVEDNMNDDDVDDERRRPGCLPTAGPVSSGVSHRKEITMVYAFQQS